MLRREVVEPVDQARHAHDGRVRTALRRLALRQFGLELGEALLERPLRHRPRAQLLERELDLLGPAVDSGEPPLRSGWCSFISRR